MSQEQPRRPEEQDRIKYGDIFNVGGELAQKPVSPGDASMMQALENALLGQTQKGGAAAAMQSAATRNEKVAKQISEGSGSGTSGKNDPVMEALAEEVLGHSLPSSGTSGKQGAGMGDAITIGEALEATALTAGSKPVEWSDAAAIQAAEVRATGRTSIVSGGVAAKAQSAATLNARINRIEEKTKLADILANATSKLPSDKPATRKDAEGVTGAEMRNDPNLTTHPAGVAASVAAAARLNKLK